MKSLTLKSEYPNLSIEECFEQYINECKFIKRLRPATIKSYCEVFSYFKKMLPKTTQLHELKSSVINLFFQRISQRMLTDGKEIKTSTLRTYYNKLVAFLRWLELKGYLMEDNLIAKITKPANPVYEDERALNNIEVSQIISAITLNTINDSFANKRDLLIISLLLYTGIRKGELLNLRIQDINFDNKTLFVNGKTSKSKKSRHIPLHINLLILLKNYLQSLGSQRSNSYNLLVSIKTGNTLTEHGLKHWVKRYVRLSGVSFYLHRCRHTFACNLAKEGADIISIMNALGHSSITMTQQYLRSIKSEQSRNYINKLSY